MELWPSTTDIQCIAVIVYNYFADVEMVMARVKRFVSYLFKKNYLNGIIIKN